MHTFGLTFSCFLAFFGASSLVYAAIPPYTQSIAFNDANMLAEVAKYNGQIHQLCATNQFSPDYANHILEAAQIPSTGPQGPSGYCLIFFFDSKNIYSQLSLTRKTIVALLKDDYHRL